ncbi:membrane protein [Gordonia phage Hexbug]|nr:membrane protein [Gordonia phage Orla]UVK62940.1 membrane protein [Gordonia phage Hexbug]WNN96117.1 membrane protein [Gordonia phage Nodigi]
MSEVWITLLSNIGALAIGWVIGQAGLVRRTKRGFTIIPTDDKRTLRLLGVVVSLIAFASLIQGIVIQQNASDAARAQTQCNNEFRATLKLRSDAANEQTEAITQLVRQLIALPDGDEAMKDAARQQFLNRVADYVMTKQANPYPNPSC